ncbi:hypothetical protein ABW19_dt0209389 [Dactylella cylindrospora]|nr:hypothetical protein ABW19_dt0209389 [Dactylella cylindrospora]
MESKEVATRGEAEVTTDTDASNYTDATSDPEAPNDSVDTIETVETPESEAPDAPLPPDFDVIIQWLNDVEIAKDDNSLTEEDIFPKDTASMASTVYYRQEPFRTYQPRLFRLFQNIVPPSVVVGTISRMKGGGNNRVAGVGLEWPAGMPLRSYGIILREPQNFITEVKAVIRTCRHPIPGRVEQEYTDLFATLTYLVSQNIKAPAVLGFDSTPNNSLMVPYMLMLRVPGIRLEDIYQSLNLKQRLRVAELIADQLRTYNRIPCATSGRLKADTDQMPEKAYVNQDCEHPPAIRIQPFTIGREAKLPIKSSTSTYELMQRMFRKWVRICKTLKPNGKPSSHIGFLPNFRQLQEVLEAMRERNFFDEHVHGGLGLHHPDFFARNILVSACIQRPDNMSFEIEGVIDWDDAITLPEVLRSSPPAWLWEWEGPNVTNIPGWEEWYGDSDELPSGRFEYRLDPDERRIKEKFDDIMGSKRVKFMYTSEYVWIRRLWKFAYHGLQIGDDADLKRFHKFIEKWNEQMKITANLFPDAKITNLKPIESKKARKVLKKIAAERNETPLRHVHRESHQHRLEFD